MVYRIALGVDAVVWQTALAPLRVVEDGHLTRHRWRQGPRTRTRSGGSVPVVVGEIERSLIGHLSNHAGSVRSAVRSARAETPVASGRECRAELRRAGQMLTTRQHYPGSGSATSHQGSVRAVRLNRGDQGAGGRRGTRHRPTDPRSARLMPGASWNDFETGTSRWRSVAADPCSRCQSERTYRPRLSAPISPPLLPAGCPPETLLSLHYHQCPAVDARHAGERLGGAQRAWWRA